MTWNSKMRRVALEHRAPALEQELQHARETLDEAFQRMRDLQRRRTRTLLTKEMRAAVAQLDGCICILQLEDPIGHGTYGGVFSLQVRRDDTCPCPKAR